MLLFILFSLVMIEDSFCRKDICRYKIWRLAYQESSNKIPEPKYYEYTKSAKILNFIISCGVIIFCFIFIIIPIGKFSLEAIYYCFVDILTNVIFN